MVNLFSKIGTNIPIVVGTETNHIGGWGHRSFTIQSSKVRTLYLPLQGGGINPPLHMDLHTHAVLAYRQCSSGAKKNSLGLRSTTLDFCLSSGQ